MDRVTAAAVFAMLCCTVFMVQAETSAPVVWWGPTHPQEGFHIRIPVTVTNDSPVTLSDPPAFLSLDLAKTLAQAGWATTEAGGRPIPSSFELDLESVRVVAMTNLKTPAPGTIDGRLLDYDRSQVGLQRNIAPSVVVPGQIDSHRAFNERTDPAITVFWRLQGEVAPGGQRHFVVYLDSKLNPGKEILPPRGVEAGAAAAIHGPGPNIRFYGHSPAGGPAQLRLVGLHDDTSVAIEVRDPGWVPRAGGDSISLQRHQVRTVNLDSGATDFRLTSDRPFLASIQRVGFVPSLQGGFAGQSFLFTAGDEAVYFIDAGGGAPTRIVVEAVDTIGSAAFHLNDAQNPFPYTVGTWASGADGNCRPVGSTAPALTRGRTYLATVEHGGPVLLQLGGIAGPYQVPSLDGAPAGTRFAATLADSPWGFSAAGACVKDVRNSRWHMLGTEAGWLQATSPERSTSIQPSGTPSNPMPQGTLPAAPLWAGWFADDGGIRDRPLFFAGSADSWLWMGAPDTGTVGPAMGNGAMEFSGMGQVRVFGLYDGTSLKIEERFQVGPSQETRIRTAQVSEGGVVRLHDIFDDRLLSFRISADRPVAVYPESGRPGFLAGKPLLLEAQPGPLEYRGHLLELSVDRSSASQSTVPGVPVLYRFEVTNLARKADGSLQSDIATLHVTAPAGWDAQLDRDVVALASGAAESVTLTVTPPLDAESRRTHGITLTATSKENPKIQVSEKVFTHIKRSFDVGLWFDLVGGPKAQTVTMGTEGVAEFTLLVRNQGTALDRVELLASPPERGWTALLLDSQGREVGGFDLRPGESRVFLLRVTPPPGVADGIQITSVQATSSSGGGSVFDRATATTKVTAPSDIHAFLNARTLRVPPGTEAVVDLVLENKGEGAAELRLENTTDTPMGWATPHTVLVHSVTGVRIPLDRITVAPGETTRVGFVVAVPPDALAGQQSFYRIAGRAPPGETLFEAFPAVVVAPHHDLRRSPAGAVDAKAGQETVIDISLENHGNLDEMLDVAVAAPVGWSIETVGSVHVPMGGTAKFSLGVRVPPGTAAGEYTFDLRLGSSDGVWSEIPVTVTVPVGGDPALGDADAVLAQPGRTAYVVVPVHNTANVPVHVRVAAAPGEPWTLAAAAPVALPAGATGQVNVGWVVPRDATDGTSRHQATIVFEPTAADVSSSQRAIAVDMAVGRPAIRIGDQEVLETPGGRLVRLLVSNIGDRTAYDLEIGLQAGGAARDTVVIQVLRAGQEAQISLLDPVGSGDLQVVVDPRDRLVLARPEVLDIHDRATPGPGLWWLLAAVAWRGRVRMR